jgi:hypothetical protein
MLQQKIINISFAAQTELIVTLKNKIYAKGMG